MNNIISIIALIISFLSILYTWWLNRRNLKIKFINDCIFIKENDKYVMIIELSITNKSNNPIKLSSIHLTFKNLDIKALCVPINLLGDRFEVCGTFIEYEEGTFKIPHQFYAFDILESRIAFIYFPQDKEITTDETIDGKIKFVTSRGIIKKKISFSFSKN